MKKTMRGILLLIGCLNFGCATIFNTGRQSVYVDSEPRAANVRGNKLYQEETTPTLINMKKGGDIYLDIAKEGYQTDSIQLQKNLAPAVWINLLLGSLSPLGLFIDWQSGAMWNYQDKVVVRLDKKKDSEPTPKTETEKKDTQSATSFRATYQNQNGKEKTLSGPRLGLTYLSKKAIQTIKREEEGILVGSVITQFGWQFEKVIRFHEDAPMFVFELIPVIGALDQNVHTETVFSFVGIRSKGGSEFALGPTWYQNSYAVGYAAGTAFKYSHLHIPLNFIVVPAKTGTSISLLTGFSW